MTHQAFPNRAEIEAEQLAQLKQLLGALIPDNAFYTAKLREAGVDSNIGALAAFCVGAPFTLKDELAEDQQAHPPYGSNLTFPIERYTRYSQTSATTGMPIRWLDTTESWSWMLDNWIQVFRAAGVSEEDRLFFAFSFGPFLGFWTAFEAAVRLGCLCIPGGAMSSAGRLRTILDNDVTALCCTPTYALRLAEVAEQEGIDLSASNVKALIVAGEPGGSVPATRARIESVWSGARVVDHHGMTEVGPVSYECPQRPGVLHIIETAYLAEIVNPETGEAAVPGDTGELVLTTLGRIGSPLLRYRTGDYVKACTSAPCECGRWELALEGGILARTDDMILVRGVNIYPAALEGVLRSFDEVAEYRVDVRTEHEMSALSLQVEPAPECTDLAALKSCLEKALKDAFNLRIPLALVLPGTLPRYEMKSKRWVKSE